MIKIILLGLVLVTVQASNYKRSVPQDPSRAAFPTVYEYFTEGGITSGLDVSTPVFRLNGKPFKVISGAIHYFRVHPDYWRDRLRKLRALGANTVETYIPWNLHEPKKDVYDFGDGNNDWSIFLDVRKFIEIAQEEDLLVLIRPGPYICTEWEFGGFPSWLQRDPDMRVREYYQPYLNRAAIYFNELLPRLVDLQFVNGGPIVGLQIENEYGSFDLKSKEYIQFLIDVVKAVGFTDTLLFTSDGVYNGDSGTILDQLFYTANFQGGATETFTALLELQPNKPVMAMEYWSGWFDHWFEEHNGLSTEDFAFTLEEIIGYQFNGSVNFYMFHGGTSFGFMAGANNGGPISYQPDISSYDYDAPLTEAGDYGEKYFSALQIVAKYEDPVLTRPILPPESHKEAYAPSPITEYIPYEDILEQAPGEGKLFSLDPVAMEDLPMNDGNGQSYGYIIHRKKTPVPANSILEAGPVKDFAFALVDGKIQSSSFQGTGQERFWLNSARNVTLEVNDSEWHNVDLFIENMGRVNFGYANAFKQKKGLPAGAGSVKLNGANVLGFEIYALECKSEWINGLTNFVPTGNASALEGPLIARTKFTISGAPADTFLDMSAWEKGSVFVNGFNLGRYWNVGPQQTLYIPAPLLKQGENTITVFEQIKPASQITFAAYPNIGRVHSKIHKG